METKLSPEMRREITPRRLAPRRLSTVPVMNEVRSVRRLPLTSTETSAETEKVSQNRTTDLSSAPRRQLEPESQIAKAVRISTLRSAAMPPLAQALRAVMMSASRSAAISASRNPAREAWALATRIPDSSTRLLMAAPAEMVAKPPEGRVPIETTPVSILPSNQARTEAFNETLKEHSELESQAFRAALMSADKSATRPPAAQRPRPALTSTSRETPRDPERKTDREDWAEALRTTWAARSEAAKIPSSVTYRSPLAAMSAHVGMNNDSPAQTSTDKVAEASPSAQARRAAFKEASNPA
ncbi:hypothetical protein BDV29DRAFT_168049 [Aspergillus leporis]|uniref:Uncharacterized protein n=1 Tax=Aspergillus leporis TaxID=41062 RepID=A0A5N5X9X9_9EURO|nr:hypothetical protein BDV29DRAFT_168049 [Aspergillus leporis]